MNPWLNLIGEVFKFVGLLGKRPRLLLFLVIFVIGIGGIGIWIPLFKMMIGEKIAEIDVYRNFATYVIAIAITSFAERFFLRERNEDDRTLTLFAFGLGLIGVISAILILFRDSISLAQTCTWISIVATFWLWFIALADSPAFEEGDARSMMGGVV